jgi:cytochrome c553
MKKRFQSCLRPAVIRRALQLSLGLVGMAASSAAGAADAARGAYLYLQTDNGLQSCVVCHGPDPGQNRNNLLRAADQPSALTRALAGIGVMGYLGFELSDADRADVSAFLGSVLRLNAPDAALRLWPINLEFGQVGVGERSATQSLRLSNPSSSQPVVVAPPRATDASLALSHNCPALLPPLAFCDVKVALKPVAAGPVRAAVEISTPAFTSPVAVGVLASGDGSVPSALAWHPEDQTVRFEALSVAPLRRVIPLFNPGPLPAVIGVTSLVGPGASNFRIDGGCAAGSVLLAGTTCDLAVTYTPSLLPVVLATLQLRSNQGNPDSILLEGAAPPSSAPQALQASGLPDSGGGCTMGPPNRQQFDPVLLLAALAAAAAAAVRGRRRW